MISTILPLSLLAAVPALAAQDKARLEPVGQTFADSDACRFFLAALVKDAPGQGYATAEGPYSVAAGEDGARLIRAEAGGQRITEYRCVSGALTTRSWLKKAAGQQ